MTKELTLKKPILAHNEKLHVLELREPTYDEIEAIGFPFTVSGDGTIKLDSAVALKYIPVLAGILVHLQRRWQSWIFLKPVCKFSVFYPVGDGSSLRRRFYNVAWFWKLNPLELRRAAISDFLELEAEAVRINEEVKHG